MRHVVRLAQELRKRQTQTEELLWERLRAGQLGGMKFRRQRPIGRFIADFCCDSSRLIVEIDGRIHEQIDQQAYDDIREHLLLAYGYTVLRFTADEVEQNIDNVLIRIMEALRTATP